MRTNVSKSFLVSPVRVSKKRELRIAWRGDSFFDLRNGVGKHIPRQIEQPFCLFHRRSIFLIFAHSDLLSRGAQ